MDELIAEVRTFEGSLVVVPARGGEFPEIAWGDAFMYYAPDGVMPREQPYGTIIVKDYPDDDRSGLDYPTRWRVNIRVDDESFERLVGLPRRQLPDTWDVSATDTFFAHPVYGSLGWVCVISPDSTGGEVVDLLRLGHDKARRHARRGAGG
ncbi:hypothetical protein GIS00_13670 [Nakamurella sp. YIM 132087]|uniref:DUF6194 domain-containing protein n=2 Tax=Nakamurella alba TaxID=2665158 RepID=A0A7K1FLK8_9ACTN|nr:hypothetical protein [Nakamurella alba]